MNIQKWEYLFVVGDKAGNITKARYVNSKELANWKDGQALSEFSNELGEEGWELIAAPYTSYYQPGALAVNAVRLIFKRPK